MSEEFKAVAEQILKNTNDLRAEVEAVKGQVDPLSREKVDRMDKEFVELKSRLDKLSAQPVGSTLPMSTDGKGATVMYGADAVQEMLATLGLHKEAPMAGKGRSMTRVKDPRTPEERKTQGDAYEKFLRYGVSGPNAQKAGWSDMESKALSTLLDNQGGYLVIPDFELQVIKAAHDEAEVRGVVDARGTSRDKVIVPKRTGQIGVTWGTEGDTTSDQNLGYGSEEITIYEQTALILIPNSTLEDAAVDVVADLAEEAGLAFGEDEDDQFATANGVNRPQGFMNWQDILDRFMVTGAAAGLGATGDFLFNALYKLKKTYRRNATWAMNSTTEGKVRQLKDASGQYLWTMSPIASLNSDNPTRLLGRPVINPEAMADVAANAFPIIVGDFRKGYKVRDRRGMTVQRLVERYAEKRMTGFLITKRVGAQPVLAEAFVPVKVSS